MKGSIVEGKVPLVIGDIGVPFRRDVRPGLHRGLGKLTTEEGMKKNGEGHLGFFCLGKQIPLEEFSGEEGSSSQGRANLGGGVETVKTSRANLKRS